MSQLMGKSQTQILLIQTVNATENIRLVTKQCCRMTRRCHLRLPETGVNKTLLPVDGTSDLFTSTLELKDERRKSVVLFSGSRAIKRTSRLPVRGSQTRARGIW